VLRQHYEPNCTVNLKVCGIQLFIVALLGPWLACPLVDRLNGLRANNGRGIRVMLVFIMLLAAVFYALLMCIPTVTRFDSDHKPTLSFFCGPERALLRHERCTDPACHSWDTHEVSYLHILVWEYNLLAIRLSIAVNIKHDVNNLWTTITRMPKNLNWMIYVRFQVFTAVLLWIQVISDILLYWMVSTHRCIGGV
jgi:hypothetical protein